MSTILQQDLAKEIILNTKRKKKKNLGELVESGGYSKKFARARPTEIIQQKGVVKALEEQGFTEENAKKVVQSIMLNENAEPNARLKATDQVFKVHGSYAPEKSLNMNVDVDSLFNDEHRRKAKEVLARLK